MRVKKRKGGDAQGHTHVCHVCVDGCVHISVADIRVHIQTLGRLYKHKVEQLFKMPYSSNKK